MTAQALTINGGSSSIKFALFEEARPPRQRLVGSLTRIGLPDPSLTVEIAGQGEREQKSIKAATQTEAVGQLLDWLSQRTDLSAVRGVGHRVVHGGESYVQPTVIDADVLSGLRVLADLDPAHLPGEISLIEAFRQRLPSAMQVACFDTAFHHDLPVVARLMPVPRHYQARGVRRYGFHGLSYTYLLQELRRQAGAEAAGGRVIFAHLGSGASMAALRGGRPVDTTMAFTPTAGLVMGTRTGDLDPGFLVYLMRHEKMSADQIDELVNKKSGLFGVSGVSSDMRDLLDKQATDPHAAEAVELFCYQARKWIGALTAALGGLDTLVFSGGIGEKAVGVRARICQGLEYLGLHMDSGRNVGQMPVINSDHSRVTVRVIPTDEETIIASAVFHLLMPGGRPPVETNTVVG